MHKVTNISKIIVLRQSCILRHVCAILMEPVEQIRKLLKYN